MSTKLILEQVREAQQAERRRTARDIHDRLGYWLGLAHIELELYELYQHRDLGRAGAHLIISRQAVAEGLAEIRRMVTDLRSPIDSLEKALLLIAEAAPATTPVSVTIEGDDGNLSDHVRGELYLVLREALRNSFTHADAATVSVLATVSANGVSAIVKDNGVGFDPATAEEGGGIPSMRERIALLGGTVAIRGGLGLGCTVEIFVPPQG